MEYKKYYIGTLSQCNYYNQKVVQSEADRGTPFYNGDNWAKPIQSTKNSELYAIIKHNDYTHNTMQLIEKIPVEFITDVGV